MEDFYSQEGCGIKKLLEKKKDWFRQVTFLWGRTRVYKADYLISADQKFQIDWILREAETHGA